MFARFLHCGVILFLSFHIVQVERKLIHTTHCEAVGEWGNCALVLWGQYIYTYVYVCVCYYISYLGFVCMKICLLYQLLNYPITYVYQYELVGFLFYIWVIIHYIYSSCWQILLALLLGVL